MKLGRGHFGLFLLLWMGLRVNGEETLSLFIDDILSTFKLKAPTIIYDGDEPPVICYTKWWVLCLLSEGLDFENYPGRDEEELGNDSEKVTEPANDGKLSYDMRLSVMNECF